MAIRDRLADVPVVGTALAVQDRYKRDAGDQFAGAIGFFGFLSLFPLLLLALAVVGFVLGQPSDQELTEIATAIQDAIPGFAAAMSGGEGATGVGQALQGIIDNREAVGIVGVVLLLSGMRVVNAAQTATLFIFRIDLTAPSGLRRKGQQFLALVVLGVMALLGVAAGGAIGYVASLELLGPMDALAPILTTIGTFLLDVVLFLAAYRLFATSAGPPTRTLVPGALFGALGWTLLKLFGSTYVSNQVSRAGELYGALGGVIGLMLLLYLAGRLYVYGAELSAVRLADRGGTHPDETARPSQKLGMVPDSGPTPLDSAAETPEAGTEPSFRARFERATSPETQARLAAMPDPPREGRSRHALAFAVAVGAVAGLAGILRPWDRD